MMFSLRRASLNFWPLGVAASLLILGSCKKHEPEPVVLDTIAAQDDLTTFAAAIRSTGLNAVLNDSATTVFAPTNEAFLAWDQRLVTDYFVDRISEDQRLKWRAWLRYHLLVGRDSVSLGSLREGMGLPTALRNGQGGFHQLYVQVPTPQSAFINAGRVNNNRLTIGRKLVYRLDRVLPAPVGDLLTTTQHPYWQAQALGQGLGLSSWNAAVAKTGLASLLTSTATYKTLLVPNDNAFYFFPAPFDNAQHIAAITDPQQLARLRYLVQAHIARTGPGFQVQVSPGYDSETASSRVYFQQNLSLGLLVKGTNTQRYARVTLAHIPATNGTMYVVDSPIVD